MCEVNCKQVIALANTIDLRGELDADKEWLWCVYWFEAYQWSGDGQLVACDTNGDLYVLGLGYDSCYDARDDGMTRWGTLTEFLASENVLDTFECGIGAKIKELCEEEPGMQTPSPSG